MVRSLGAGVGVGMWGWGPRPTAAGWAGRRSGGGGAGPRGSMRAQRLQPAASAGASCKLAGSKAAGLTCALPACLCADQEQPSFVVAYILEGLSLPPGAAAAAAGGREQPRVLPRMERFVQQGGRWGACARAAGCGRIAAMLHGLGASAAASPPAAALHTGAAPAAPTRSTPAAPLAAAAAGGCS